MVARCAECARAIAHDAALGAYHLPRAAVAAAAARPLTVTLPRARACPCGALVCGECSGVLIAECASCARPKCAACYVGARARARESSTAALARVLREGREPQGPEPACGACCGRHALVVNGVRLR